MTSYFRRLDHDLFTATEHTSGAWSTSEQHIAPMNGLIVHEIERHAGADDKLLARLSVDILGVLAVSDFTLTVSTLRPGRTIELVEARVAQGGRDAVVARAWRLLGVDSAAVAGGADTVMPEDLPAWDMAALWDGGFIASLDVRRGPDAVPGRARAWIRTPLPLLADEESSTLARWFGLLDTANGIAVREQPKEWLFPNLDLTCHLQRQPASPWVGLDTSVTFGAEGLGITESDAYDAAGRVGRVEQILTVRPAR